MNPHGRGENVRARKNRRDWPAVDNRPTLAPHGDFQPRTAHAQPAREVRKRCVAIGSRLRKDSATMPRPRGRSRTREKTSPHTTQTPANALPLAIVPYNTKRERKSTAPPQSGMPPLISKI